MYYSMSQEELRIKAKKAIENFELWARRFIDTKLVEKYGTEWYNYTENGQPLVKSELKRKMQQMLQQESSHYPRAVDVLLLDDVIYLLCREDLYNNCFSCALQSAYPQGRDVAREFLSRLVPIRNKLNHANPISVREAEKAICYTNDFVDCLKDYYRKEGMEKMFNVPMIIKVSDSLGNQFWDSQISRNETGRGYCSPREPLNIITTGEPFSIEAEIDPSFAESTYSVAWLFKNKWHDGKKLTVMLDESDVRMDFTLYCRVISNQHSWHRCGDVDDSIAIVYKVVPPMH